MNNQIKNTTAIIQGSSGRGVINQLTVVINYRDIPGLKGLQLKKKEEIEQGIKDLLAFYFAPGNITNSKVIDQEQIVVKLTT